MGKSNKTIIIIVAAIAVLLALYSGWRAFGGSGRAGDDRKNGVAGPISPMSSMLGPDASGKPQTQAPPGGPPPLTQPGQGVTPMQRMMGPSGQPR